MSPISCDGPPFCFFWLITVAITIKIRTSNPASGDGGSILELEPRCYSSTVYLEGSKTEKEINNGAILNNKLKNAEEPAKKVQVFIDLLCKYQGISLKHTRTNENEGKAILSLEKLASWFILKAAATPITSQTQGRLRVMLSPCLALVSITFIPVSLSRLTISESFLSELQGLSKFRQRQDFYLAKGT